MKTLNGIFVIVGIVTILGSALFLISLATVSSAIGTLPSVGEEGEAFVSSLQSLLTLGWVWGLATLIAGGVSIRAGLREK